MFYILFFLSLLSFPHPLINYFAKDGIYVIYGKNASQKQKEIAKEIALFINETTEKELFDIYKTDEYAEKHHHFYKDKFLIIVGDSLSNSLLRSRYIKTYLTHKKIKTLAYKNYDINIFPNNFFYHSKYGLYLHKEVACINLIENPFLLSLEDEQILYKNKLTFSKINSLIITGTTDESIKLAKDNFIKNYFIDNIIIKNFTSSPPKSVFNVNLSKLKIENYSFPSLKKLSYEFIGIKRGTLNNFSFFEEISSIKIHSIFHFNFLDSSKKEKALLNKNYISLVSFYKEEEREKVWQEIKVLKKINRNNSNIIFYDKNILITYKKNKLIFIYFDKLSHKNYNFFLKDILFLFDKQ